MSRKEKVDWNTNTQHFGYTAYEWTLQSQRWMNTYLSNAFFCIFFFEEMNSDRNQPEMIMIIKNAHDDCEWFIWVLCVNEWQYNRKKEFLLFGLVIFCKIECEKN